MIKKIIFVFVCVFSICASHVLYSQTKNEDFHNKNPKKSVEVFILRPHVFPETVMAYATVRAKDSVQVNAQDSGIIHCVNVTPGQKVHKGALLFILDSSDTSNQLRQLEAAMRQAKHQYDREKALSSASRGSVPKARLLDAKLAFEQAKAVYEAEQRISYITSPVDGMISNTDISAGAYVQAGTLLTTVISTKTRQLNYQLPERYIDEVRLGQKVRFAWHKRLYDASVSYISPAFDANNRMFSIKADIVRGNKLPQNAFVQITHILNPEFKHLAIPQAFAQTDIQGFYFYSVVEHKIVKQYFSPGDVTSDGWILVESGVKVAVPVVISDSSSVTVGEKVIAVIRKAEQVIAQPVRHRS